MTDLAFKAIERCQKEPEYGPKCSYCNSYSHYVRDCDLYDFHHDMGMDSDPEWARGREMVLARRQAHSFGGIPEMYLANPTPEQSAVAHAYEAEQARKYRQAILEGLKK